MTKPSVRARDGVPTPARDRADRSPAAATLLPWAVAAVGIVWLIAKLWAADQQIRSNAGGTVAIATAALAIPAVVQATAVGGLAGGLALRMAADHWWVRQPDAPGARWRRRLAAVVGGLVVGIGAMGAILGTYGDVPSIAGVAAVVAIAGTLAGALAGTGRRPIVATAALAAALASTLLDTVLNSGTVLGHMMAALGAGSTAITDCDQGTAVSACAKVVNANSLVSHIDSLIVGVVAGLIAFWCLRRDARGHLLRHGRGDLQRSGRAGARAAFPAYLLAGGATGLLLLGAEVLTHVGGAGLLRVARSISADDRTVIDLLAGNRVIHGLLVLFVGAFVALVSFGRTLRPERTPPATVTAGGSRDRQERVAVAGNARSATATAAADATDAPNSTPVTRRGPADDTSARPRDDHTIEEGERSASVDADTDSA